MTKLVQRGQNAAASLLVPSIVLLALALALLAIAMFPAAGLAAEEEGSGPVAPELSFPQAPLDFGKATVGTETAVVTVTVHNSGTTAAAIDKVTVEGGDSGEFKLSGSNCGWLEPGQDCSAWIAFAPGSLGAKGAQMVVQPKEFPAQTTPIAGTGVAPQFAFAPGSYDFGIQRTNESHSASFWLQNTGEAFADVGSIGVGGPGSGNFWVGGGDCWNGRRLYPGEGCNVQVNFNAWDAVDYEAELQAYVAGSTFGVGLHGTGGRPMLEADANPVGFGAATVGAAGEVKTIVLTNNGNIGGAFFIAVVAGGDSGSFQLLDESCTGAPIQPAGTCTAHIRFAPQGTGTKVARLALFGEGDGGTMVMLEGEGVAPAATLAPASFDFDSVAAGDKGAAHGFVIRNDGSTGVDLDRAAIVGVDLDQFALAGDECSGTVLAPGAECAVRVRFTPDSAGTKTARLRVSGPSTSLVAELSGEAGARVGAGPAAGAVGSGGSAAVPGAPAAGDSRPGKRRGKRRFARGATVSSVRGRALRRADLRARTVSR